MALEQKRDLAISFVRMLAMMSIVTCHVMQYYNMELAWWFNVGVQMFLCISGYLYGMKRIPDISGFYRKNFVKILIDYEIVMFAALAATSGAAPIIRILFHKSSNSSGGFFLGLRIFSGL